MPAPAASSGLRDIKGAAIGLFEIPAPLLEQETSEVACQRENHSELRVFSQPELILITVLTGA